MSQPPTTNPLASPDPWNLVADGYDEVTRALLAPFSEEAVRLLAPTKSERALDVACGPGTTSLLLAPLVRDVTAIDFATAMCAHCRRNLASRTNVEVLEADGQNLPFPEASFDVATSMFGLMFFPDRRRGMSEMRRVLRPGGRAVISSWGELARSPGMQLLFSALRAADPTRPAPQKDITSLENTEVFAAEMTAAGFRNVVIHDCEQAGTFAEGPEEFWSLMTRGSAPLVLLRRRLGEVAWAEAERLALGHLRSHWSPELSLTTLSHLAYGEV